MNSRITRRTPDGYTAENIRAAVEKLGCLEDWMESMEAEIAEASARMQALAADGKLKSATYRQLFANKLTLQGILERLNHWEEKTKKELR